MYPNAPLPTLLDLHLFGVVFLCVPFLGVGGPCVVFLRWGRVDLFRRLGRVPFFLLLALFFPCGGVCTYLPLQGTPLPSGRLYVCSAGAVYLCTWDVSSLHWGQGEPVSTLGMRVRRVVFLCVPLLQWMCAWEEGACVFSCVGGWVLWLCVGGCASPCAGLVLIVGVCS